MIVGHMNDGTATCWTSSNDRINGWLSAAVFVFFCFFIDENTMFSIQPASIAFELVSSRDCCVEYFRLQMSTNHYQCSANNWSLHKRWRRAGEMRWGGGVGGSRLAVTDTDHLTHKPPPMLSPDITTSHLESIWVKQAWACSYLTLKKYTISQ